MTRPARIPAAEITRAFRALAASPFDRARVVLDYENRRIEVIIGDLPDSSVAAVGADGPVDRWEEDDDDGVGD